MLHNKDLLAITARLKKFAWRLTKNAQDADDLLQSTFLKALENKDKFEDDSNLFSWTSRIMFNLFASAYRRHKKFASQCNDELYIDQIAVEPTQESCTDLRIVSQKINQLTPEHQKILIMVCVQDLTYEQVASILNIPIGTVRSRLSRARSQLKYLLLPTPQIQKMVTVKGRNIINYEAIGHALPLNRAA